MKDFKQLRVWKKGMEIVLKCYQLVQTFPKEELYGLSSQITRAAVSIPSNIAEGSAKESEKEQSRYLQISLGSAYELETHLAISQMLEFGNLETRTWLQTEIIEEQKMLLGFLSRLKAS